MEGAQVRGQSSARENVGWHADCLDDSVDSNKKGAPATLGAPTITFAAVLTETVTDILEPWPVKIVVD